MKSAYPPKLKHNFNCTADRNALYQQKVSTMVVLVKTDLTYQYSTIRLNGTTQYIQYMLLK